MVHGNCLDVLKQYPDNYFDSVVTDPPYGLSKEPDIVEVLRHWLDDREYKHPSKGYMGNEWDTFVPSPLIWKEVYRVLKHGGHIVSFAGTRTYGLMEISLRFAGFEIRDMIEFLYLTGMSKSKDIGKAFENDENNFAKEYEGWGTQLKPSHEPIVLARKPLIGTVTKNIKRYKTGAMNIDKSRIATEDLKEAKRSASRNSSQGASNGGVQGGYNMKEYVYTPSPLGRFPSNCITVDDNSWFSPYFNITPKEISKKASKKDRGEDNTHPTVKSTHLMKWLINLITPKNGIILDPFCGSGSTLVAAKRENYDYVGIDEKKEYVEIAINRLISVTEN